MKTEKCTKQKFNELYSTKREDDGWDFKEKLELNTKKDKYNLIKDFLAFSNYGGGYIVIGIQKDNKTITGVSEEIDPANLGNIIEKSLGFSIEFQIKYFEEKITIAQNKVGLIYIFPSKKLYDCPKDLHDSTGKTIIRGRDIFTRRNTRSIKASGDDIMLILNRIKKLTNNTIEIKIKKKPIYQNNSQENNALWDTIVDKFTFSSENTSINLRYILNSCEHSVTDFASLLGISPSELNEYLNGEKLPTLEILYSTAKITNFPLEFFFTPNYLGFKAFWKEELIRYSLEKLVCPQIDLNKVKFPNNFFGDTLYLLAKEICYLRDVIVGRKNSVREIPDLATEFINELARQYYKLLEQIPNNSKPGFTETELIIRDWFFSSNCAISRVILEGIKKIKVDKNNDPIVITYFGEEIKNRKIKSRYYDEKNLKIVFSR